MGGDYNYPPYSFLQNGSPAGFDVEMARAVGEAVGFDIEFRQGPWSEMRHALERGEIDVLAGMAFSEERDLTFDFSTPYTVITFDFFVHRSSPITSLESARGKQIIVQQGGLMDDFLRNKKITDKIILVPSPSDALILLSQGTFDAAIINKAQGFYFINELGLEDLHTLNTDLNTSRYGFAVLEGNDELLLQLNQGLNLVKANGQYQNIYEKWFGVYENNYFRSILNYALFGLAGVILLLSVSLAWSGSLQSQVKRQTEELRKSEERFRMLYEKAPLSYQSLNQEGELIDVNPTWLETLGYSLEEVLGKWFGDFLFPDSAERFRKKFPKFIEAGIVHGIEFDMRRKNGSKIIAVFDGRISYDKQGQIFRTHCIFRDITEQRWAQEALSQQMEHLSALRAIDLSITTGVGLDETLNVLLEQVLRQLRVDGACVYLYHPKKKWLEYAAGNGSYACTAHYEPVALGERIAGRAALTRQTVVTTGQQLNGGSPSSDPLIHSIYYALPLVTKNGLKGVLEICNNSTLAPDDDWIVFLETLANQAAIAIENATLLKDLQQANQHLSLAYDGTIEGWAQALELRDVETQGHSRRVAELTVQLSTAMGICGEELVLVRRGALLHDIGKMGVPDSILFKPGSLTEEEMEVMRRHVLYGYQMLSQIEFLKDAMDIPYCHHEKWDGSGYPRGLKGEEIPLSARIFAVVDVWDALNSDRPYRKRWTREQTMAFINEQSGKHFDPHVLEVFKKICCKPEE